MDNRIDIMVDLETLGTESDSTIFQIAAIAFDIKTGEHISSFDQTAKIELNTTEEMKVTGATLQWWILKHTDTLKELLSRKTEHSSKAIMINFHQWLMLMKDDGMDLHLWGNGILFDNKMIQHQMVALGLEYPIFFRNDRDQRTLIELAAHKLDITPGQVLMYHRDESLTVHDAFDDVRYQIRVASACYNTLIEPSRVQVASI